MAEIKRAGGGSTVLARKLGLHFTTVSEWTKRGRVPAHAVLAVERETGIPASRIRPDIYPPSRFPPLDKGDGT
jgi:DNA-binding transcriptional regulator YdaS (Cro superfamily)